MSTPELVIMVDYFKTYELSVRGVIGQKQCNNSVNKKRENGFLAPFITHACTLGLPLLFYN